MMAMPTSEIIVHKKTETRDTAKLPPKFNIVALNDSVTSMEFVVHFLTDVFNKSREEATIVMLKIHNEGKGICGTYPKDIAEAKFDKANNYLEKNKSKLRIELQQA